MFYNFSLKSRSAALRKSMLVSITWRVLSPIAMCLRQVTVIISGNAACDVGATQVNDHDSTMCFIVCR